MPNVRLPLRRYAFIPLALLAIALLVRPGIVFAGGNPRCAWSPGFHVPGLNKPPVSLLGGQTGLYARGNFSTADDQFAEKIAKWDGSRWSAFKHLPAHAFPEVMTEFDAGNGPQLTVAANGVFSWTGTDWEALGTISGRISDLAVMQVDGKTNLIAGGQFRLADSSTHLLARWDGKSWISLMTVLPACASCDVLDFLVLGSGANQRLYVAGEFRALSGVNAVLVYDGIGFTSLEGAFLPPRAYFIEAWDDGSGSALYAADFTGVAKWNGATWVDLGRPTSSHFTIYLLEAVDDGNGTRLYLGGRGEELGNHLLVLQGSSWQAVEEVENQVTALADWDDGNGRAMYVGGFFMKTGDQTTLHIARRRGTEWSAVSALTSGKGVVGAINTLESAAIDGKEHVLFGGDFRLPGDSRSPDSAGRGLVSWRFPNLSPVPNDPGPVFGMDRIPSGAFQGTYLAHGAGGIVSKFDNGALAQIGADGGARLVMAFVPAGPGPYLYTSNISPLRFLAWDGNVWKPTGDGVDGPIYMGLWSHAVHDDGSGPALYVSGRFETAGGMPANNIARWHGLEYSTVGDGLEWAAAGLASFDDGSGPALYAITPYGPGSSKLSKWDGTEWTIIAIVPVAAGRNQLKVFDDGTGPALYIAGYDSTLGNAFRLLRWNAEGFTDIDSKFVGRVNEMKVLDDGTGPALYLVGDFGGDLGASGIARFCSPLLFADGFESGDFSQWSVVSPEP